VVQKVLRKEKNDGWMDGFVERLVDGWISR
jgi:hypothetical protein